MRPWCGPDFDELVGETVVGQQFATARPERRQLKAIGVDVAKPGQQGDALIECVRKLCVAERLPRL